MMRVVRIRIALVLLMCAALSGCTWGYDVTAVLRNGVLHFAASRPVWDDGCVREIEVVARSGPNAAASPGDDELRISHGTYWYASVDDDDDCANRFPIAYGTTLQGEALLNAPYGRVSPNQLPPGEYYVFTKTGGSGNGIGRFILHANGRVENLPPRTG
jgi:hypothetical protein